MVGPKDFELDTEQQYSIIDKEYDQHYLFEINRCDNESEFSANLKSQECEQQFKFEKKTQNELPRSKSVCSNQSDKESEERQIQEMQSQKYFESNLQL